MFKPVDKIPIHNGHFVVTDGILSRPHHGSMTILSNETAVLSVGMVNVNRAEEEYKADQSSRLSGKSIIVSNPRLRESSDSAT